MSMIQFQRPEERIDTDNSMDAQAYDSAKHSWRTRSVAIMEHDVNEFISYMQRLNDPTSDACHRGELSGYRHSMEWYYQDRSFAYLTSSDQQTFLRLIFEFGIQHILPAPLPIQFMKLYGVRSSGKYAVNSVQFLRGHAVKDGLGEWSSIRVSLPEIDRSRFYAVGTPTVDDPLALMSSGGLTMNLARMDNTGVVTCDNEIVVTNVAARLYGSYVRESRGRAMLTNETDLYDIALHLNKETGGAENMSFDASK